MAIILNTIWLEHAVASHPSLDGRIIIGESRWQIVDAICELPAYDSRKIAISLPNRGAEPFGFEANMISDLTPEGLDN